MFGLDELIELIDELRLAGYEIGTQQYISAQDLLLALAARDQLPDSPRELRTWLAPLLCSSPKEQEHFYQYYEQWLTRHSHLLQGTEARSVPEAKPTPTREAEAIRHRRLISRLLFLNAIAAVMLIGGVAALFVWFPRSLSGTLIDAQNSQPLRGATIKFAGQTIHGDDKGHFIFNYLSKNATTSLDISVEKYEHKVLRFTGDIFLTHKNLGDISLRRVADGYVPTPVLGGQLQTAVSEGFFARHFLVVRISAVSLPVLVFGAGWLRRKYRRRALLRRLSSAGEPHLKRLVVKGAAIKLYRGQPFRRIVQELRRHRRQASREVDAQLTVEATVQRAGLFVPLYASRNTLPEYLALVDRTSLFDQQARLEDELINRLTEDNVFVDRYYFNEDPRTCRTDTKQASFPTLYELASRHPDHHLVIFGDASGLFNPLTGEPEQWIEMFSAWHGRAVFTPEGSAYRSYRGWTLSELGFAVLPAGVEGLAALADVISSGALTTLDNDSSQPFPELLRENSRRWLERHETESLVTERLWDQLQNYLGEEGFQWLCACAVYPMLSWDLTLYFGYKLMSLSEDFEKNLLSLVRLPWFRHGHMPDWLRASLISAMSETQHSTVRRMIEDLLTSLIENPTDGICLEIAPRPKEATSRGWRKFTHALATRLRNVKRQGVLSLFFRALPKTSPLRDFVFLSFMAGRKPRKLDVSVPTVLRRILYPQGQALVGLRTTTAFVLAVSISLAVWSISGAWQRGIEPPGSTAGPSASDSSELKVTEIYMAKDDNGRPGDSTTGFKAGDHTIHCVVNLNKAITGTNMRFVWTIVNVEGTRNQEIRSVEYTTKALESVIHCHLTVPQDWPTGTYKCEVYVNKVLDGAIDYAIE